MTDCVPLVFPTRLKRELCQPFVDQKSKLPCDHFFRSKWHITKKWSYGVPAYWQLGLAGLQPSLQLCYWVGLHIHDKGGRPDSPELPTRGSRSSSLYVKTGKQETIYPLHKQYTISTPPKHIRGPCLFLGDAPKRWFPVGFPLNRPK